MTTPSPMASRARAVCDRLGDFAEALTTQTPMPGGVIVIADADGTLATRTFGLADIERGLPVSLTHRFQIGSISKVFVGLLINQLVDEGRLALETPIGQVLDWLADRDVGAVTVRQLLNHSGGLVAGSDALVGDIAQAWALRDLAMTPPGQQFHYSNAGYVLLGLAASAVTGIEFPALIRSRLLEPMGMTGSTAAIVLADRPSFAVGYEPARDDQPWAPGDALTRAPWVEEAAGAGNVSAPGDDIGRLIMLLLGSGEVQGRQVVSTAALARVIALIGPGGEPILDPPGVPAIESSRYGLGVNVERIGGHECLSHGGGMVGYSTFVLVDRTAGIGVAVLTNASGDCPAAQLVARVGLALLSVDSDADPPMPSPDADVHLPAGIGTPARDLPLGRFVSRKPDDDSVLEVATGDDGRLVVRHGGVEGRLFHNHKGRLVTDHPLLRRFHLDVEGIGGTRCWVHGPDVYYPNSDTLSAGARHDAADAADVADVAGAGEDALTGHYRSHSPWYTNFRIIRRLGRLLLVAPGGVEAPDEEEELVALSPGVFRIGAESGSPERLVAGPIVAGQVISVARDGCVYSRTFTP